MILNSDFEISNVSGIWKLEIGISGNSHKLTSLGQIQYIGYLSHSIYVTELDFWKSNIHIPEKLEISKSEFKIMLSDAN